MIEKRFGRKGGMIMKNLIGIVGDVMMGWKKMLKLYEFMLMGRLIIGVNCGIKK
jgi:SP family facilitated glucose transporter-like MFS transporter 1